METARTPSASGRRRTSSGIASDGPVIVYTYSAPSGLRLMLSGDAGNSLCISRTGCMNQDVQRPGNRPGWVAQCQSDAYVSRIDGQYYPASHAHITSIRTPSSGSHGSQLG